MNPIRYDIDYLVLAQYINNGPLKFFYIKDIDIEEVMFSAPKGVGAKFLQLSNKIILSTGA